MAWCIVMIREFPLGPLGKSYLSEIELIKIDLFEIELFQLELFTITLFGISDLIRKYILAELEKLYGQSCLIVKGVRAILS